MNTFLSPTTIDIPSSPGADTVVTTVSEISTPLTQSGRASPNSQDGELQDNFPAATQKKKKKKKTKKSSKAKDAAAAKAKEDEDRPPVLCISRNKHWRYISSYHVCLNSRIQRVRDQTQPFVRDHGFSSP